MIVETHGINLARIQSGLEKGRFGIEDGELHKRCSRCRDLWPADTVFFPPAHKEPDGLHSYCRACVQEWTNARRRLARGR